MYVNHTANMKHDEMNSFLHSTKLLFKNQTVALYFKLTAFCLKDRVACSRKHIQDKFHTQILKGENIMTNPSTNFICSNNLSVFHFIKRKLPLPRFTVSILLALFGNNYHILHEVTFLISVSNLCLKLYPNKEHFKLEYIKIFIFQPC